MDLRDRLLQIKRHFEEEEKKYSGSDPLNIRCQYIQCLERYDKEAAADIYLPVLEDTLKQFKENPVYKQDLRFIQLWINYSTTQPNPIEVMERMHNRGLGTECAILYSSWAELLIKQGQLMNADNVFKMGLNNDVKPKGDLQKHYEDFLKDIGQKVLMGKITCPKCGSSLKSTINNTEKDGSTRREVQSVQVWEWNPLKVGDKDDFTCPLAYFEDPDPKKIRMYPRDQVYPENGDELSLEEIMAREYERRYREEEAKQKALAEALAREEEAKRARQEMNDMRKKEAEKFNSIQEFNPVVQAAVPVVTPKMLNIKSDMDNSLANSTTFTVHTKEAMNVVQDMWSSPTPSDIRAKLCKNEGVQIPAASNAKTIPFEIYTEENPPQPTSKQPFQIYDENVNSKTANRPVKKPVAPFEIYDENAPPNQDIIMPPRQSALKPKVPFEVYQESQVKTPSENIIKTQDENKKPKCQAQLFNDDCPANDLAEKFETQAKITPFFNVQPDKNDDFSDITCNTEAFKFVLPSSTPMALHKKPLHSLQKFENQPPPPEGTNLSVILESSKDKSNNSSASSGVSTVVKTPKSVPVLPTDVIPLEDPESSSFPIPRTLMRPSSLYRISLLDTITEESQESPTNSSCNSANTTASKMNITYIVKKAKVIDNVVTVGSRLNVFCDPNIALTPESKKPSLRAESRDSDIVLTPAVNTSNFIPKIHRSSSAAVIDKENLSPGMLGFPSSISFETTNSSTPMRRSSRMKSVIHVVKDKENIIEGHVNTNVTNLIDHSEFVPERASIQKKLSLNSISLLKETIRSSLRKSSSSSKIPLRTLSISKKDDPDILNTALIEVPKTSKVSSVNFGAINSSTRRSPLLTISNSSNLSVDGSSLIKNQSPVTHRAIQDPSLTGTRKKKFHNNCIPNNSVAYTNTKTNVIHNNSMQKQTEVFATHVPIKPMGKRGRKKKVPENIPTSLIDIETRDDKENIIPQTYPLRKRSTRRTKSIQYAEISLSDVELNEYKRIKPKKHLRSSSKSKKANRRNTQDPVQEGFDPFSSTVIGELLDNVGFPKEHHRDNYHVKQTNLPTGTKNLKVGDEVYSVLGEIGKGAYAKVVKASLKNNTVALKIEKPPCKWEYYIAKEIQARVPAQYALAFMDISAAYIYNNGSILETQYAKYGTLITNINAFKESTGKWLDLGVILHFSIELIDIVDYLHKSKIIHADLKPDNILVREFPAHNENQPCLQLIDFGRCIDMSLLPPGTEFYHVFKTEDNKCIEMKENKPWTYQIDLQGLASVFHCMLNGEYIKVQKKNDKWTLQKLLSRNVKREVWTPIFDSLLNVNPATDLPFNFSPIRQSLVETFESSLLVYLQHLKSYRLTMSTYFKK